MSDRAKDIFASYDYKKTEEYKRHERAMREIDQMSREEKLQTLIEAGIVNEEGKLTKRYGGDAPNPED